MKINVRLLIVGITGIAGCLLAQTNQPNTNTVSEFKLPSLIVMPDGQKYDQVKLIRAEPDGLFVSYRPETGGQGMAKLKFYNLSDQIQKHFGYSAEKRAQYEHEQAKAELQWAVWQGNEEEKASKARAENEAERIKMRAYYESLAVERAKADAQRKEAEAEKIKAEAERIKALNPTPINIIQENQMRNYYW